MKSGYILTIFGLLLLTQQLSAAEEFIISQQFVTSCYNLSKVHEQEQNKWNKIDLDSLKGLSIGETIDILKTKYQLIQITIEVSKIKKEICGLCCDFKIYIGDSTVLCNLYFCISSDLYVKNFKGKNLTGKIKFNNCQAFKSNYRLLRKMINFSMFQLKGKFGSPIPVKKFKNNKYPFPTSSEMKLRNK